MLKTTKPITLDVANNDREVCVYAKQGDVASRNLLITLLDNGTPLDVATASAVLQCVKPDGTQTMVDCTINGNVVTAPLSQQTLACYGYVSAELSLYGADGALLTTGKFCIDVEDKAFDDSKPVSSDEYQALQQAFTEVISGRYGNNALQGKTVLNFGDSISAGMNNGDKGYAHLIAERNRMNLASYACSGACISPTGSGRSNCVLYQLTDASETQADFVLLEGGYNDCNSDTIPLGTISAGYEATLNPSTFCGALESLLKLAKTKYQTAQTVFIIAHKAKSRAGKWEPYAKIIREACEKWSVSTVDMCDSGGLNGYLQEMIDQYTDTYGTHPNESGYLTWYVPMVEAKMMELSATKTRTLPPDTFSIPGAIPWYALNLKSYTVMGGTQVENGSFVHAQGTLKTQNQEISIPALAQFNTLEATSEGSGTITKQTSEVLHLKTMSWSANAPSENSTSLYFIGSGVLPDACAHADNTTPTDILSTHFPVMKVNDALNPDKTTECVVVGGSNKPRIRIKKETLIDAGFTADNAGFEAWIQSADMCLIYKTQTSSQQVVPLDTITSDKGYVVLTGGYSGGSMVVTLSPGCFDEVVNACEGAKLEAVESATLAKQSESIAQTAATTATEKASEASASSATSTAQSQLAANNKTATDQNKSATDQAVIDAQQYAVLASGLASDAEQAAKRAESAAAEMPMRYYRPTEESMETITGAKQGDLCYVTDYDAGKTKLFVYDTVDMDEDNINPEWVYLGILSFSDLNRTDLLAILQLAAVATTGNYNDLLNKPSWHRTPIVLNGTAATLAWDYTKSDTAMVSLTADKPISITGLYPGCKGTIAVYGAGLMIPVAEQSLTFGMLTPTSEEHAVYSFWCIDGTNLIWTIMPYQGAVMPNV